MIFTAAPTADFFFKLPLPRLTSLYTNKLRNLPANLNRTRPAVSQPIACLCSLEIDTDKKQQQQQPESS